MIFKPHAYRAHCIQKIIEIRKLGQDVREPYGWEQVREFLEECRRNEGKSGMRYVRENIL